MRISYAVFCLKKKNIKTSQSKQHTYSPTPTHNILQITPHILYILWYLNMSWLHKCTPLYPIYCYMRFVFNVTATTEIYTYGHTLSLHDALPICWRVAWRTRRRARPPEAFADQASGYPQPIHMIISSFVPRLIRQ